MAADLNPLYTQRLRDLMAAAGIASFKALERTAEVSGWAIRQLRSGQVRHMRLGVLQQISIALQVPLTELLGKFDEQSATQDATVAGKDAGSGRGSSSPPETPEAELAVSVAALQQEYQRLQHQMANQQTELEAAFQQAALEQIESWMVQWPTAAYAAQQNSEVSAARLVPLMKPLENLLTTWAIEPIGEVGAEIPYDPQRHQLMGGTVEPGTPVKVRYVGYLHRERLLHRAKVSPIGG